MALIPMARGISRDSFRFSVKTLILLVSIPPLVVASVRVYTDLTDQWHVTSVSWSPDATSLAANIICFRYENSPKSNPSLSLGEILVDVGTLISRIKRQTCIIVDVKEPAIRQTLYDLAIEKTVVGTSFALSGHTICFSSTGCMVGAALHEGALRLWDIRRGKVWNETLPSHENWQRIAISHDARIVAVSCRGGYMIADLPSLSPKMHGFTINGSRLGNGITPLPLCFSPADDRLALAADNGAVILTDTSTKNSAKISTSANAPFISDLCFSQSGKSLVAVYAGSAPGISVINTEACREKEFISTQDPVWAVSRAPDENRMVAVGPELGIVLFERQNNEIKHIEASALKLTCVAWSPDGSQIATGGRDGQLTIWDANSLTRQFSVDLSQSRLNRHGIVFLAIVLGWIVYWVLSSHQRRGAGEKPYRAV